MGNSYYCSDSRSSISRSILLFWFIFSRFEWWFAGLIIVYFGFCIIVVIRGERDVEIWLLEVDG